VLNLSWWVKRSILSRMDSPLHDKDAGGGGAPWRGGGLPNDPAPGHATAPGAGAWPFVDRDGKLRAVLEPFSGPSAGAVVVSGPPGCGRTRLAQEAVAFLRLRGRRAEWVTGTRGAAAIPLGALAHLLPVAGAGSDPTAAWQALLSALDTGNAGTRVVIGIDDAHLLDDLSAALVHKIVLTRLADVVVTVLGGAPAPDHVDSLWRDGLAARVELQPLTRSHVEQLLTAALMATPESRTTERLAQGSSGSAVLLRELVQAGQETGRLREVNGVWQWKGDTALTERLCAVVRSRLGEVADEERSVLELLAVGGALELDDLVAMSSAEVVAGLERRGLVVVEQAARRPVARFSQPLHAQVLCAQMPQAAAGAFRSRLAGTPSVRRWAQEEPLRIATLLIQLHGPPRDQRALARAAAQANAGSDHELAERLARAALDEGPDPAASVALAEALRWQGRSEEAASISEEVAPLPMGPCQRKGLALTSMLNLFYGLGRPQEALAFAAPDADGAGTPAGAVAAVGHVLRLSAGESWKAEEPAPETAPRTPSARRLLVWGGVVRSNRLALLGQTDAALASTHQASRVLEECTEDTEASFARASLHQSEWMALELGGRIEEAEARAAEHHRATMARPASATDAVAALGRGSTAVAAGRLLEAVRWLTEAAARLQESDPLGSLPLCRAKQAQTYALLGDPDRARSALMGAHAHPSVRVFEPEAFLADAWCAAVTGEDREAREAAMRAVASANGMGQHAVTARALDTAARLGLAIEVTGMLQDLSVELGGRWFAAFAAHADAAARGSGEALEAVAAEFRTLGALVLAADAYAAAAKAHRYGGHRRRASAAGARATVLSRAAGGLRTPALDQLTPYELSTREREIATLAADGVSNRSIARRLVLSVRTVETHLAHVYDKLGINNRAALREALSGKSPPQ
jgi:DNA-binding CsgD family transcriptional regulator